MTGINRRKPETIEERISVIEFELAENSRMTRELLELLKGAKAMRSFLIWITPPVAVIASIVTFFHNTKG